ncbi:hypothetical protein [Granulicella sibirica]|uniref:Uncharacterized protein n=1 Tax=Granulicella sibirica TaxID=2479048 RepID=A0A4Q0SW86_9BACT|nr:hypothetical protein GRAN_4437 [Granulicella sibirica]
MPYTYRGESTVISGVVGVWWGSSVRLVGRRCWMRGTRRG